MQFHTLSAGGAPQGRPATFCAACAAQNEWQTALGPVRSQQPCTLCFCDISGGWIEAHVDLCRPVEAGKRGSPLCCVGWQATAGAGSHLWKNRLRVRTGDPQGDDLVVRYPKGLRHFIKAVGGRTTRITSTQTQHDTGADMH